jgi:hypothetical protein
VTLLRLAFYSASIITGLKPVGSDGMNRGQDSADMMQGWMNTPESQQPNRSSRVQKVSSSLRTALAVFQAQMPWYSAQYLC